MRKTKFKKALEINKIIHETILMGVTDKYIKEEKLEKEDFGLQLLGRSLNWAIPDLNYDFEKDLDGVADEDFKKTLRKDEDQIFIKGLAIINSDYLLEKLITFYISYEMYLFNNLFSKDNENQYPGIKRMRKFIFQTLEKEPNIESSDFKEKYKNLFIEFNDKYGKYGKVLKKETIDSIFSFI